MISKHFSRKEFACRDGCGFSTVDVVTLAILEDLREWAGAPVTITSGCRCIVWNTYVSGAKESKHLEGRAADVLVASKTPFEVYSYLCKKYPEKYCFLLYNNQGFVHIDSRSIYYREVIS